MDYFKELIELLKQERETDRQAYISMMAGSSIAERRANGVTWYPIAIRGNEMVHGDYINVEVERTTHHEISHQIRFGTPAMLFSNHDPVNAKAEGIISFVQGNTLKITLHTDELPDWSRDGKLGIELLFDDNSYDEMGDALRLADIKVAGEKNGNLVRKLIGGQSLSPVDHLLSFSSPHLNSSQETAIANIISGNELSIVHGPPGTGKTTTIVEAVFTLFKKNQKQILVTAPSNTAVDLLTEKLAAKGIKVVRIGNPVRISANLISLTLDHQINAHSSMKQVKNLRKQANEYRNLAHKYKRSFGKSEREQRKALFAEAYKIIKEINNIEQYVSDDILNRAEVITCTLVGSNHHTIRKRSYETIVIDEAGQAIEPACWIPILKGKHIVMAGDPFQLPPTVKSYTPGKPGLQISLLEKLIVLHPERVTMLDQQYRMNKLIMGYSSAIFYKNKLKADHTVEDHLLFKSDKPFLFIDTAGCGFEERTDHTAISNPEEAAFVLRHLDNYLRNHERELPASFSIAVISPYKQQVLFLLDLMNSYEKLKERRIDINTIDGFQGQERDIVYISLVRSNSDQIIGFLSDIRRMNVAMTRARKKLVIVGDSATLSQLAFYNGLIQYAEVNSAYESAWEHLT